MSTFTGAQRLERVARAVADAAERGDALTDAELLSAIDRLGDLVRLVDSAAVALSAQVVRRSDRADAADSGDLARAHGARGPADLVVQRARVASGAASAWVAAARATAARTSLTGEPLPPAHPAVAAGLLAGRVDAATARAIATAIDECSTDPETAVAVEQQLVDVAATLTPRDAAALCRRVIADYAPLDAEERERRLRARRGLAIGVPVDGMTRMVIDADPESAGFLLAALDARTAFRRGVRFRPVDAAAAEPGADGAGTDDTHGTDLDEPAPDDRRTLAQRRLDALVDLCRESLGRDDGELAGMSVSMLVTVPLEVLATGVGTGVIGGVDEPVCATTVRRLAAGAEIIPVVLGGEGEVLDAGESRRFFSRAQRRAMAARDGGCVFPGCTAPPSQTEAAHWTPWAPGPDGQHGPTDIANGVLLCWLHHRVFDEEGWNLEWRDGVPWFVPPPWVDPTRRPRRGGRPRLAA
ncbi:DUF222 domain-containing protein [Galbitalea sp. SE-J8]|uniref:DUF222 domain-containing protein n=1 Tax=Galbitalea sp. SE-J8 TaxID=3054952 RepID=UPI00259CB8B6|nr:DUF222 domain-containing protein [Galbitalea sp. SE-J8]MDM4762512.1 DUF222 domain-containing protein [Galbitalea sp. SE-J8]